MREMLNNDKYIMHLSGYYRFSIMTGNGHIELFKVTSYNFQSSRAR